MGSERAQVKDEKLGRVETGGGRNQRVVWGEKKKKQNQTNKQKQRALWGKKNVVEHLE